MRKTDDLRIGIAKMLHDIRVKHDLSKAAIARIVEVDDHTWRSWESGKTCPSVADFVAILDSVGEPVLPAILACLYPENYSNTDSVRNLRGELSHFTESIASDHAIEIMSYIAFGDHGSNFAPQMELMCAYNHLPLEQRFLIAESIYTSFLISSHRGDLVVQESVMPDMPTWEDGLKKAQRAAYKRMQSYSTVTEE